MKILTLDQIPHQDVEAPLFTDKVSRQTILASGESEFFNASIVNFPQGVRNKFHTHTCDQILIITKGRGIVATEDEEITVTAGDVVWIPAGEKHWHGASNDSDFAHITITQAGARMNQLED